MPSFADSFWSEDLMHGLNILFDKLYKGCDQSDSFIQLFASRMQYEVTYGRHLCSTKSGVDVNVDSNNLQTIDIALDGIMKEMENEGNQHLTIASNIESLVLKPFSKWCEDHRERIKYSDKILNDNVRNFQKSKQYVSRLEKEYFSKCKKLEDFKRITFNSEEELQRAMKSLNLQKTYEIKLEKERNNQIFAKVGGIEFDVKTMKETIREFLTKLPKTEYKLPLISYVLQNTNNGSEITKFILEILSVKDTDQAENVGQDLLNLGFIKYCNGVGTTFVNSKKFQYQWKDYAYKFAEVTVSNEENEIVVQKPIFRGTQDNGFVKYLDKEEETAAENTEVISSPLEAPSFTDSEKELFKLIKEADESDAKYFKECYKMDSLRCSVEELMIDHLAFMEKCESDREKAIKKATMDFCATISNKISILKLHIDKMIEFENDMNPTEDLMKLIATYNTGLFQPKVITYNNYYNPGIYQNFGIDLETRCRLDKKVVPLIVTVILSYMDQIYPDLPNDKVRTAIWTNPVQLRLTHELRSKLNKTHFESEEEIISILSPKDIEPSVIASVLKIYLLELPEALVPSDLCEVLKVLYSEHPPIESDGQSDEKSDQSVNEEEKKENESKRIIGLFTTFAALPKPHLATLDALTRHFYRLIKILKMANNEQSSDTTSTVASGNLADNFKHDISKEFANSIVHAKEYADSELGYKIFYDLLTHRKRIFSELKRHATLKSSSN